MQGSRSKSATSPCACQRVPNPKSQIRNPKSQIRNPKSNWYALYTKPHCERGVSERLQAKGFETYLPVVTVDGSRGNTVTRPFFPCYLFVRLDLDTDRLSQVHWTPGLKHVVSFGERPAVVPDEVITLIRERLAAIEAAGGLPAHGFQPGDPVGPFADFEVVFEQTLKPAERAWVLIQFLGEMNRLQVSVENPEPVDAGSGDSTSQQLRRTRGHGRRIKCRTNDECLS